MNTYQFVENDSVNLADFLGMVVIITADGIHTSLSNALNIDGKVAIVNGRIVIEGEMTVRKTPPSWPTERRVIPPLVRVPQSIIKTPKVVADPATPHVPLTGKAGKAVGAASLIDSLMEYMELLNSAKGEHARRGKFFTAFEALEKMGPAECEKQRAAHSNPAEKGCGCCSLRALFKWPKPSKNANGPFFEEINGTPTMVGAWANYRARPCRKSDNQARGWGRAYDIVYDVYSSSVRYGSFKY